MYCQHMALGKSSSLLLSFGIALLVLVSATPSFAQSTTPTQIVTVTASPYADSALSVGSSEVSRDQLLRSGGFGLGDAIKNVPGVTSSGFTAGAQRPVIRGLDASRVRVTENGLGSHDVSDVSADHGVPIDPLSATEIEIVRGPATLRFGSQAIGGVVNAINNRIPFRTQEGDLKFDVFSSYATNADERMIGGLADYGVGSVAFHVDAFGRDAGSYTTPLGRQINSFARANGFSLGSAGFGDDIEGGFSFTRYNSVYGIPSQPGGEVAHIDMTQNKYNAALHADDPIKGVKRVTLEGSFSDYQHDEILQATGPASTFINREWEGRAEATHAGFDVLKRGAVGVQAGLRNFEALGEGADYLLPTRTTTAALYIFEEFSPFDRWTVEFAARAERVGTDGSTVAGGDFSRRFTPASVALGAVFNATDALSFFADISRTARAPNVTELFAQGPHEATETFELGNPAFNEEVSRSVEIGVQYEDEKDRRFSVSLFRSSYKNFIFGMLTGNSYDEDGNFFADNSAEFAELVYMTDDARFRGIETQAHLPLFSFAGGQVGVDGQFDYVRAELGSGQNVPRIPPLRYGGGFFFESERFDVSSQLLKTASQRRLAPGEMPTGGHISLDASASLRLFDVNPGHVTLTLAGSNLTNDVQRNHVSFTKNHVLQPGRNVRLLLRFVN